MTGGTSVRTRAAEPGHRLTDAPPRTLGTLDQVALWGNLAISLLGFPTVLFVIAPTGTPMSLLAAFGAVVLGTVLGAAPVAVVALAGARTGSPSMVLLRGLFGTKVSYVPTVLNLLQCLGWAVFELVVISTAAHELVPGLPRWLCIVIGGALTTVMALRPLGMIRTLRRYALGAVAVATLYFLVQFARHPLPALTTGGAHGFWLATDAVVAVSISWVPLAADYTRHARSGRAAFTGCYGGYVVTQTVWYALGLLAVTAAAGATADPQADLFRGFLAVPFGWLPFAVLVLRELDESFTNVYSTVVSTQNLRPLWDRRVLAVGVGTVATVGALVLHVGDYQSFLYLIGSVFVPLSAVFVVDFALSRGRWDTAQDAAPRWAMLVPWLIGFATYQLINPGGVSWWARGWASVQDVLGFTPASWMSASILSFAVAAVLTALLAPVSRARPRRR